MCIRDSENAVWVFQLHRDEAALTEHSSSDAMKEFLRSVTELIAEPPVMVFATPVQAKGFEI